MPAAMWLGLWWLQLRVTIVGFNPGDFLSVDHTCDGANLPLTVQWKGAPPQTEAYVVRMYDPDAPGDTFTHWLVYNLTGEELKPSLPGLLEGYNDFGQLGYGGPCPPPRDQAHRYVVEVYALRRPLRITPPVTWKRVRSLLEDKVLARGETFVRYKRTRR
ncbi:MAG: YbhB/YbcL family Raf kinase inhibitor-like protein [Bacteroidia bacterium]|nr:YbhB/YbcL family Raf kinase inhibitor-like protein [Bacteroidia bacterium]MDW8088553.1 YbhB/YbcL family Raf kinase inhibitor-like protein [Bacteroidia bacterium]